jgi:ferredoxin-NADP reductase/MOSC domain-containing protein YiiM/ferredoxin
MPPVAGLLVSVNVGLPEDVSWQDKTVHTGIWKRPVDGPRMVRTLNIDGDGQGDKVGHGGAHRAVLVYQMDSYDHWKKYFGRGDFSYGQFGENLTVEGLADDEVCIGDRYQIGEAEFEVTQPRVTCFRVAMRLGEPDLPALLVSHHRPGFYMRVVREGRIEAGDQIVATRLGPGALSVADADALLYLPGRDAERLRLAVQIPALSPGWKQSFRDLLARHGSGVEPAEPSWSGFRTLRVSKVVSETPSVVSVYLVDPDGKDLPPARPGQYLTLRFARAGEPPPVRSYSLSSTTGGHCYRISVKQKPHGLVSTYLNQTLKPGETVEAAAARGEFVLDDRPSPVLLVSAGIGVTPLLAMLYQLDQERSERAIWWIHAARRPDEDALANEAKVLLARLTHAQRHVFLSAASLEECKRTHAEPGRITIDRLRHLGLPSDASAYICGPSAFMVAIQAALADLGLEPSRVRTEVFDALASINPGLIHQTTALPHAPIGPPAIGPLVTFARSGISTPFDDRWKNVLELAEACDVSTRWSCRTGVCHTCTTPLVSGSVSYRPEPLERPDEATEVLICCARPETDLVLDM